ncbi:hypothetical protein QYE76_013523, partial [Lolium multiflorum]
MAKTTCETHAQRRDDEDDDQPKHDSGGRRDRHKRRKNRSYDDNNLVAAEDSELPYAEQINAPCYLHSQVATATTTTTTSTAHQVQQAQPHQPNEAFPPPRGQMSMIHRTGVSRREMKKLTREINLAESIMANIPEYVEWSSQNITFSRADHPMTIPKPGHAALVVEAQIGGFKMRKVFMDGGSGLNLIFVDTIKNMASPINFNQFLEKEKLKSNGSNFIDWFRHVRIFLNGGNLQYVLDAPLGDPPAETETDEVKNVYATRKTRCMMEEGSSISEHMLVMTGHAKKLNDLGIVIPNGLGIHRVLQSLPPSYKNFVMNYNMQNMNKEFPELFGMLKAAEIEIKKEHQVLMVNKTTSFKKQGKSKGKFKKGGKKAATPPMKPKNGPKPDAECYYCKEKGHWKRNCSKYLADLKSGLVKKKKEDDLSRYGYIYLMKHKSETFEKFKEFQSEVENQRNKKIKFLRSDRGGEYLSYEFGMHLKKCGIPQRNGVSERRNRTLLDM